MLFPYLFTLHFSKFTRESSLFMEKPLLMEKSKAEESPREKKEKKTGSKTKERVPLCRVKNKIPL